MQDALLQELADDTGIHVQVKPVRQQEHQHGAWASAAERSAGVGGSRARAQHVLALCVSQLVPGLHRNRLFFKIAQGSSRTSSAWIYALWSL